VFSVLASGTGPLSYQWRREGADLAGQTSASLTLANVQASDAGAYTVVVRNAAGSITSQAAILRILLPPTIIAVTRNATSVNISFSTVTGLSYVAEYSDALGGSPWVALPPVTGTGGVLTVTDPGAAGTMRFYRVHAE